MSGQVGSQIKMSVGKSWLIANVRTLRAAENGMVIAHVDFLGEGDRDANGRLTKFRRGVTRFPIPGCEVHAVTTEDLRSVFAAEDKRRTSKSARSIRPTISAARCTSIRCCRSISRCSDRPVPVNRPSVALILHRISQLSPEGHIVMIDPHGEYSAAFKGCGELFNVDNLQLPYWLMNFEEHCEVLLTTSDAERQRDADILAKCLLAARTKGKNLEAYGKVTVDSPIPYLLTDLTGILTNEMGKLDRAGDTAPFQRLKTKIDELRADPRYTFMFSGMLVSDTMGSFLAKLFRLPSHGRPISIVDVSGVPSDITSVVVSVLARMVFDYAIWSRNEPQRPLLLVCEEAHRYVPKDDSAKGQAVAQDPRADRQGRPQVRRQPGPDHPAPVGSGRRRAVAVRHDHLDAPQQRPRPGLRRARRCPKARAASSTPSRRLRNRECIVCGEGVAIPIRVRFDDLEPEKRPASSDPSFAELWRETGGEEGIIQRTVKRWRGHGR